MTEATLRNLPIWDRVMGGDVATAAAHRLRTLGHADVRRWLGNRIDKISPLFDSAFRAVAPGLAVDMIARVGEWNVLGGRFWAWSYMYFVIAVGVVETRSIV